MFYWNSISGHYERGGFNPLTGMFDDGTKPAKIKALDDAFERRWKRYIKKYPKKCGKFAREAS